MYLLNQATLATWHRLNNAPKWRTYLTLLYSIVLANLGKETLNFAAFTGLRERLHSANKINDILLPDNKASS